MSLHVFQSCIHEWNSVAVLFVVFQWTGTSAR